MLGLPKEKEGLTCFSRRGMTALLLDREFEKRRVRPCSEGGGGVALLPSWRRKRIALPNGGGAMTSGVSRNREMTALLRRKEGVSPCKKEDRGERGVAREELCFRGKGDGVSRRFDYRRRLLNPAGRRIAASGGGCHLPHRKRIGKGLRSRSLGGEAHVLSPQGKKLYVLGRGKEFRL